jgi:hypothetical protein
MWLLWMSIGWAVLLWEQRRLDNRQPKAKRVALSLCGGGMYLAALGGEVVGLILVLVSIGITEAAHQALTDWERDQKS